MVTYEREFKEQAVKMATEIGTSNAATDLGIPVNTLYGWIARSKKYGIRAHVGSGYNRDVNQNEEMKRLIKRNKELERANEILKEALGFFAVSQKK